jgi:hypothetical protein
VFYCGNFCKVSVLAHARMAIPFSTPVFCEDSLAWGQPLFRFLPQELRFFAPFSTPGISSFGDLTSVFYPTAVPFSTPCFSYERNPFQSYMANTLGA